MRVVLLGPNGQLGHDIRQAHEAVGQPFELIPVARDRLDVTASSEIARVLGEISFDALVNCTSYHRTDEAEDNATLAFNVNAHAVQSMATACAEKGARFLHVSTDYVFGGDQTRTTPLTERAPTSPVNVYGASKAMGERLARIAWPETMVLRVASLFGVAGASGKGGNFVETMIRFGREKGALRVVEDQIMSPTATADIAATVLRMLDRNNAPGIWHVVNSGTASWYDFAREIIRRAGVDATVTPCNALEFSSRAMRPGYSALDNGKVAEAFGPMPDWQDALDRYLRAKGHISR